MTSRIAHLSVIDSPLYHRRQALTRDLARRPKALDGSHRRVLVLVFLHVGRHSLASQAILEQDDD